MSANAKAVETIEYAFAGTSLGRLIVGMSGAGIVWASLGEDEGDLLTALARKFPRAELAPAGSRHEAWVAAVVRAIESPSKPGKRPPLDLRGTEFQRAVWNAMLDIPPGQTKSYGDIAREIGRPTAVRAVGQACGANPVGYVVPCHRVVGSTGALTGYAGGLATKRALLEREGVR